MKNRFLLLVLGLSLCSSVQQSKADFNKAYLGYAAGALLTGFGVYKHMNTDFEGYRSTQDRSLDYYDGAFHNFLICSGISLVICTFLCRTKSLSIRLK